MRILPLEKPLSSPEPGDHVPPSRPDLWCKATLGAVPLELIQANPLAYVLAAIIVLRARWGETFNPHGLKQGEALLGDYERYGMSEQQYRTAKAQLTKWKFATFRATNAGTIGQLMDTRLFTPFVSTSNDQNHTQATDGQRTANGRPTTNYRSVERKTEEGEPQPSASKLSGAEIILRQRELERVEAALKLIRDNYASHQSWSTDDRTEYKRIKPRREELKKILGLTV